MKGFIFDYPIIEECYVDDVYIDDVPCGAYILCKYSFKPCRMIRFNSNVQMYATCCDDCMCFTLPGTKVYKLL